LAGTALIRDEKVLKSEISEPSKARNTLHIRTNLSPKIASRKPIARRIFIFFSNFFERDLMAPLNYRHLLLIVAFPPRYTPKFDVGRGRKANIKKLYILL